MSNYNPPPSNGAISNRRGMRLFALFCVWLLALGLLPVGAAEPPCPVDGTYATYEDDSGELHIPALEILDAAGQSQGFVQAQLRLTENTPQGSWFELISASAVETVDTEIPARYEGATGIAELNGYILGARGEIRSFNNAKFTLDAATGRFLMNELTDKPFTGSGINAPVYQGDETVFSLVRGGADQFLLPVEIGNQTLNLLVDTGSDALLVFEDRLSDCNRNVRKREDNPIRISDTPVSKSYASGTREGVLATAPVRIGTYAHPGMQIMLIQTPDSQNDPSLTAKGADGIIGLRHTAGLNLSNDAALLDAPLNMLSPLVGGVEFNLPPAGEATLAFGKQPLLEQADENYVFRAKARAIADPNDRTLRKRFADMQVPFRVKTRYGEAATDDLDILLDTGAVSRLVLDTQVAEQLGYNSAKGEWMIDDDEDIELNLIGLTETTTLYPKFKVWEVSVAPYGTMGVEFEAVLGISRWQEYVVGFDFVPEYNGGPDGTISLLRRTDMHAISDQVAELSDEFMPLPGLNSVGNDEFPATNHNGDIIVFQSDRDGGAGGLDIYVWQRDVGLLSLPDLNTTANEMRPVISADGQWLAYESDRDPNKDLSGFQNLTGLAGIYLYDLAQQQPIDLPEINSDSEDSMPTLNGDGRYIAFVSYRDGDSDIYLYDRDNATFVDLPGVNSGVAESAPTLSDDGRYLAFTQTLPTDNGQGVSEDIRIYDIQTQTLLPLSNGIQGVNTPFNEQQPALLGNQRLAFHSNRRNPEMGLYNRDLFVIDMITQIPTAQIGLNSDFDEIAPRFSGDGSLLVFQSRRPGGLGGSDIYLYALDSQADNTATVEVPPQDIAFNPTDAGLFTAPVAIEDQNFNLLVDTHFNALVVFQDRATNLSGSDTTTVNLGNGQVTGTLATVQVQLGQHQAGAMRIVLADRTDVETVLGISTGDADGILGLAWQPHLPVGTPPPIAGEPPPVPPSAEGPPPTNLPDVPLQVLQPAVNLLEMNFGAQAGLTLNRLPVTGDNERAQHTAMPGVGGPSGGYTDLRIPVTFVAYGADDTEPLYTFGIPQGPQQQIQQLPRAALCSLFTDQIMLDRTVAEALGYDAATQSWGPVERLDLSFLLIGSDALLPIADKIAVNKIQVTDFSQEDYRIVLGSQYWNRYTLGIDYLSSGSAAMLFLADSADFSTVDHSIELAGDHFIPLPGVNTIADEEFGTLSADGKTIAFYSNRRNGHSDIYVWRVEEGLLDLPNLNSDDIDRNPSLNGDGTLLAFESTRNSQSDIMLYDLVNREFIDLPGLNTDFPEEHPVLSADGSQLAYISSRDDVHNGSLDIYFYDIDNQQAGRMYSGWLNTSSDETEPSLNGDGSLLTFSGANRADGNGINDVYVYDLQRSRLLARPNLGTQFMDTDPALSANGHFLAFFSDRYEPNRGHLGNDIFLMELSSGELLDLPGLNSDYEDTSPALTQDAEYILFQSKRPGGEGGYDLYLYHRDTKDDTRYIVSNAYLEEGYVTNEQGQPQANALVQVTDGDGNAVGSAETDSTGNFTISIPAGVVLPLAYVSDDGTVVIDEVGDDTYVPNFEAGNLKFTQVWVEDTLQAGMPTKIWFDVETDTPKYNTFVKLYLVKLTTGSIDELDVNGGNFDVAHTLTALSIEKLGQVGPSDMVTETQGQDIITEISYLTEDNRQAHVEHSFIVPANIEDGTYAVVFSINRFDYHHEDDALQSEDVSDRNDNFLAAPATVIVGQPDKPNLRILSAELNSNSFELPAKRPSEESTPFSSELTLNMEVESMAQDTELPVDIVFSLDIDGQSYPLTFADNQGNRPAKLDVKTYPVTCREETRDGYPEGDRCASLFRQEQTGYTYKLYIDETTYDALATKTADTLVDLVIQLDPEATVDEWENNTADNVKVMPVMYLAPRNAQRMTRSAFTTDDSIDGVEDWPTITDYGTDFFIPLNEAETYGNDDFGVGYAFNAGITYQESCFDQDKDGEECDISGNDDDVPYPSAASLDATGNEVYVNIFGNEVDILTVDVGADLDGDSILCTWFAYDVEVIEGLKTWDAFYSFDGIDPTACESGEVQELEIWSSQDDDGNELYTVSKSKDYEKTFMIGTTPITVAAGATGDLGIRGTVTLDTTNTIDIEVGPYLELKGYAEGGIGTEALSVGIGIELLVLGVDLPFHTTLQVLPSYPLAIFTFEAPLIISTLDGKLYLYIKSFFEKETYTILKWNGFEWEFALIDPVYKVWAESDQFVLADYSNFTPVGFEPEGADKVITDLDYDWGIQPTFDLLWQGDFNFGAGAYAFRANTDESLTVMLDEDGDDIHETTLLRLSNDEAVDLAGYDDTGTLGSSDNKPSASTSDALSGVATSGSMDFDGNDHIDLSDTNPIPADVGTIEHWVKRNGTGDVLVYTGDDSSKDSSKYNGFGYGNDTAVEIHTGIDSDGKAFFTFEQIGSSDVYKIRSNSAVPAGEWHHIAASYDYQGDLKLYVDGVEAATDTIPSTKYDLRTPSNYSGFKSYIGRPIDNSNRFNGSLDEVRIWSDIRTEEEINTYMNTQLTGDEEGLVAYYRFDDPSVSTFTVDLDVSDDDVLGLQVEYENSTSPSDASVSFDWSKNNSFTATYYDSTDWSGDPAWTTVEDRIDHDWGSGSPGDSEFGMTDGDFSVEWEGTYSLPTLSGEQNFVFSVTTDDISNVQLYVDGNQQTGFTQIGDTDTYYVPVTISNGASYTIKLKYSHDDSSTDAVMKLAWLPKDAWLVTPFEPDGDGGWSLYGLPVITNTINQVSNNHVDVNGNTVLYDALWDFNGFFNFSTAGTYDFIVRADDGIKLYVDGAEYLGSWSIDEATAYIVPVELDAGYHLIKVEHYDQVPANGGNNYLVREIDWSLRENNEFIGFYYSTDSDMDADDPWDADSYDGTEPLLISKDASDITGCSFTTTSLDCDWGTSSPVASLTGIDSAYLNTDGFGVRWMGDFDFSEGVYVFTAKADDSLKLWVDDAELLETGADDATYQEAVVMLSDTDTGDSHNLRIEYRDNSGNASNADVAVGWSEISQDTFNVQYFDSSDFTGTATDGGTVSSIDYSSGADSARWVGVFEFEEIDYTFTVNTDGGVRVYVDGEAVIDQWTAQSSSTEYTATVAMEEGLHSLKVEYFEGNSGSPAIDVSWLGTSEIAGNALSFDGSGDYVELNDESGFDFASDFTVETWFKVDSFTKNWQALVTKGDDSWRVHRHSTNNTLNFAINKASGGNVNISTTTDVNDEKWHHVAAVADISQQTLYLYLDGVLENSASFTDAIQQSNYPVQIGANAQKSGREFHGNMDELRIWNMARSQAEIQAWMKSTLNGDESNLVAYYQFDQSSGTTATDSVGSYDGTLNGDPQWVTSDAPLTQLSPPGSAMSFDGSGDYVEISGYTGITGTDSRTVEAWVKTTSTDAGCMVSWGSNSAGNKWVFRLQGDGTVRAEINSGYVYGSTAVNDGNWHHVAVTFEDDGSPNIEDAKLYVDGVLEALDTISSHSLDTADGLNVKIGNGHDNRYFNGEMDEVRIWNVARRPAEIQTYMNRTLDGDESGLVAYYDFDEMAGSSLTVLTDIAGGNDGTLKGNAAWVNSDAPLSKLIAPGNALSFDGTDDYVALGNILPNAYTKEAWIKRSAGSFTNNIISSGDGTSTHAFYVPSGQGFKLSAGHNGAWTTVQDSTALAENTWYHVAVTYDGSSEMNLYKDGVLVDSATGVSPLGNDIAANIGKHNTGNWFGGEIDEVRIWDFARTQAEIEADMNSTVSSFETGLVAYYRFDQSEGTELVDVSSHDHDGTINGNPVWLSSDAFGNTTPPGNALSFDGSDDYVELPVALNPATVGGFTTEAWFKADSLPDSKVILSQQDGTGTGRTWLYYNSSTGTLGAYLNGTYLDSTITPSVDVWYHVAMVYDGSVLSLYLDGELKAGETWAVESADGNFILGANKLLNSNFWDGALDEVRFWSTARTQAEIQAYMNKTLNGSESGLVAYYNFDETGSSVTDVTGSGYDGTLNGDPTWVISEVPMD